MPADWTIPLVLAALFIATVIRSAFGFGEALIAVPLLALAIPVEVAVPLAVLVSVTVALAVVVQDWRQVHVRSAAWLVFFSLFGYPLGLWLLAAAPEPIVKGGLAAVIIAFSSYALASRTPFELKDDKLAFLFGFTSGVMGGAYGMNGPPLAVYGTFRRWSPQFFRATLQGYFLPASLVGMASYWLTGLWVWEVTEYYLLSLPAVAVAILVGRWLNRRLKSNRFLVFVHLGLVVLGAVLLMQALW